MTPLQHRLQAEAKDPAYTPPPSVKACEAVIAGLMAKIAQLTTKKAA